ncbi:MAG: undecaprenyl-phosphate glucose phosphotransferase [Chloroflexia bacterium]|nr:undecaprenyl-phosphate glucose phosphotransferase [Chloroflexia bacterium]
MKKSQRQLLLVIGQILLDLLSVAAAFSLVYRWRFEQDIADRYVPPSPQTGTIMLALLLLPVLIAFQSAQLYNLRRAGSPVDQSFKVFRAISVGTMIGVALNTIVLRERFVYSALIVAYGWLFSIVLVVIVRFLYGQALAWLRQRGYDQQYVLIVGAGEVGQMILEQIELSPRLGYQVVGFLDENGDIQAQRPILAAPEEIATVLAQQHVDEVIVAMQAPYQRVLDIVSLCGNFPVEIKVYPDAFQIITRNEVTIGDLNGLPLAAVRNPALGGFHRVLKRAMDICISSLVLVLAAPLLLLIALLIKLQSPGPALYIQERVGLDGKPFYMIKFRTMAMDAEKRTGPVWAAPADPRVTPLGRFLRRYSLDELPQFINVLLGDMSVVGPRAERPCFVEQFSQMVPGYMQRHKERAGITGWAQIHGLRGDTSIEERTKYDLYYVENWSIAFDLKIMVRTVFEVLSGSSY